MVLVFILCSCTESEGSDPFPPLTLEKTYYEVMLSDYHIIQLTSGSDRISATVGDENVLSAECYVDGEPSYTRIILHGLQKGSTTLTLTDEKTGVTQTAEVKVTDNYLAYDITFSNHPILETSIRPFLINNEARDCYFFIMDHMQGTLRPTPIAGSYEFRVQKEADGTLNPYLYLSYPTDDGNLDDDAPATAHEFRIDLDNTLPVTLLVIEEALGVDLQGLADQAATTRDVIVPYTLRLTVPDTDYVIEGCIDVTTQIPENVLK